MTVYIILSLLFFSIAMVVWATLDTGSSAWGRYSEDFTRTTDNKLRGLFLFADARKLLALYALSLLAIPFVLWLFNVSAIVIILVVFALYCLPKVVLKQLAVRRRNQINRALPDALQQISGAMRAGSTFTSAIQNMVEEQAGPISQEFSLLLREQRLGARLEEALDNLGERVQTEEMDLVISATLISQDIGGNLSEILQRLSETIRRKLDMEGKVTALTSQGVLQGYVVTALPFMIMMALTLIEPAAIKPLFTSILGWVFLAVILVLQIAGGVMIRKIVSIDI